MTNITGDKMFSHIDRVAGDFRPITADIFLTNYCNNRCPYCTYARWELPNGTKAMTYEEFITYVEKLRAIGVQGFILTGGGEPTICPDFQRITSWLEEQGLHYGINTNFNNLMYFKPDYLKVSLDGYDEDSYERSRGVRKYRQVVENIKTYAKWRRENSPDTSLGVQFVADSVEGVLKFYEANRCLDVDYYSFRPLESTGGSYYRDRQKKAQAREITAAIEALAAKDSRVTLNFKWDLQYPVDPCLPAGEAINCHCIAEDIIDESILGLSIEERQEMRDKAIAELDEDWEKEVDEKYRAMVGLATDE